MEREDVKDLTLSILVVVAVVLSADAVWLHVKCARQSALIADQTELIGKCMESQDALAQRLELHINPPSEPSLIDKAKAVYADAVDSSKSELRRISAAAKAGCRAAREEYRK